MSAPTEDTGDWRDWEKVRSYALWLAQYAAEQAAIGRAAERQHKKRRHLRAIVWIPGFGLLGEAMRRHQTAAAATIGVTGTAMAATVAFAVGITPDVGRAQPTGDDRPPAAVSAPTPPTSPTPGTPPAEPETPEPTPTSPPTTIPEPSSPSSSAPTADVQESSQTKPPKPPKPRPSHPTHPSHPAHPSKPPKPSTPPKGTPPGQTDAEESSLLCELLSFLC